MTSSRLGPRKPGQRARFSAAAGTGGLSGVPAVVGADAGADSAGAGAAKGFSGASAAGADWRAEGSSPAWARSRSSGVGVHRQWRSEWASPVIPPVRRSVNTPHASRMATTNHARRGPPERRRAATAQHTRERLRSGMEKMYIIMPIPAFAMDWWTRGFVANTATIIRTMAPMRSNQGARLKNSHHTRTASPQTSPPIIPNIIVSGATKGMTNQTSHCRTTATTPGHSRKDFRGAGSSILLVTAALACDSSMVVRIVISLIFQSYYYFSSSVSLLTISNSLRDLTQCVTPVDDRC